MGNAVILAGGDSKRMGAPKPLLRFGDLTLIELLLSNIEGYFNEVILVTDRPELYSRLPVKVAGDVLTHLPKSSLRGIHAGLSTSSSEVNFVVACDMPFVKIELVKLMFDYTAAYEAVVPRVGGHYQPLFAFYRRSCLKAIESILTNSRCKVTDFYPLVRVKSIPGKMVQRVDPEFLSFININTTRDYEEAQKLYREKKS